MIDVPGIQGGTPEISSDFPKSQRDYFIPTYPKKERVVTLYLGEIVQGVIIDIQSPKEATVLLPNGTFKAELKGKLKTGDTLFFKVIEVSPSLVLKIWAVPIIVGKNYIETKELVRILDLPDNKSSNDLIEYYRTRRSTIVRDEVLMIYKTYINLGENEITTSKTEDIFKTLYQMNDYSLPLMPQMYYKIKPAYLNLKIIQAALNLLESYIVLFPPKISYMIERSLNNLKNPDTDLIALFKFFSFNISDNYNLYNVLNSFAYLRKDENESQEQTNLKSIARTIVDLIESQHILNSFAIYNNNPLIFFVPLYIFERYYVARISLKRQNLKSKNETVYRFSITSDTEELGEVLTQGTFFNNAINANISSSKDIATKIFSKHINKLNLVLKNRDYKIDSMSVNQISVKDFASIQDKSQQNPQKLSIVI